MKRARASLALAQLFERIGFAALALAFVFALVASGACASTPPGFAPIAPRVIDRPEYGRCLESGGKLEHEGTVVSLVTNVCLMTDAGAARSSSPASTAALDPKDASAESDGEE